MAGNNKVGKYSSNATQHLNLLARTLCDGVCIGVCMYACECVCLCVCVSLFVSVYYITKFPLLDRKV